MILLETVILSSIFWCLEQHWVYVNKYVWKINYVNSTIFLYFSIITLFTFLPNILFFKVLVEARKLHFCFNHVKCEFQISRPFDSHHIKITLVTAFNIQKAIYIFFFSMRHVFTWDKISANSLNVKYLKVFPRSYCAIF